MRIALVGLGDAGFHIHLPALAGIRSVRIVGACDPNPERRTRAARTYGVPVFADFDDMLAAGRPDVVVVGTPPDTHADYCLRAIAAGAHVICEKPFVSSLAQADHVLRDAERAQRGVAVNHQFGEMPIFRAVREQIGHAGDVTFVQVWQLVDMPPSADSGWRGKMHHRTLFEAGVHLVDLTLALFGEKPQSVIAATSDVGRNDGVDAIVVATLQFSRGRLALITQSRVYKGQRQYMELRADTPAASWRASFGGRLRLSAGLYRSMMPRLRFERGVSGLAWREAGDRRTVLARNPRNPMLVAARSLLKQTLAAFRDGREPPASGARARDGLEVIAACYHSAETGRCARLDGDDLDDLKTRILG